MAKKTLRLFIKDFFIYYISRCLIEDIRGFSMPSRLPDTVCFKSNPKAALGLFEQIIHIYLNIDIELISLIKIINLVGGQLVISRTIISHRKVIV